MQNRIGKKLFEKSVLVFAALALLSCAGGASAKDGGAVFADIQGREWVLAEVRSASGGESGVIRLDRQKLAASGFEGVYTIKFDAGQVSGMGAPNRYLGPYTLGEGRMLSIGNVAGTLMAPFKEPEDLKEHEYFALLGNVSRWDLREDRLELFTADSDGRDLTLIFD
jgi:heat shock protein HslJ